MNDGNDGLTSLREASKERDDEERRLSVESRGGLVEKEEQGFRDELDSDAVEDKKV